MLVLAVVAPRVAAFGFLVIAVVAVMRAPGDVTTERPDPRAAGLSPPG